jgi:hypothetical protein
MKDTRHHIALSPTTYDAIIDTAKSNRDTMDDIVLRLLLTYSKVHHVDTENIRRALNGRRTKKDT